MPPLLCPRCQRANPDEARFCFYDGAELRATGTVYRGGELGREFVFPSGRRCKTYDDLVRGCSEEWAAARDMLRQGGLRQFLAGIGRVDLAKEAERAAAEPDSDIALDQFLAKLPTREAIGPRLDLVPRRLNLGKLRAGESRQYQVKILNQGARLLHGTLQVMGADWVTLGGSPNGTLPIKAGKQQVLTLQIDTFGLVAGQRYAAKLTLITNGGAVEVPITMELTATPFPHPPLQGAASPRELAAKMKEAPKQVGPLLESGEIQRWFAANGWRYPVQGAQAKGIAAVQQFFEGLGLSKPPQLAVSDYEVLMLCRPGQTVRGFVTLKTPAKKWVYARVESDSPWLTVLTPDVGGAQQARVEFEANARGLEGGRRHQGRLTILANGGQRFTVTVTADVRAVRTPLTDRLLRYAFLGALSGFLVRLLLSLPDLYARDLGSFGAWLDDLPAGYIKRFALVVAWVGVPLGGWLMFRRGGLRDVPAGLITGAMTGLAASVTFACVLRVLDALLGWILPFQGPLLAVAGWAVWGAAVGVAAALTGRAGRAVRLALSRPYAWLARHLGRSDLAERLAE
jgi:hypothetical protein